MSNFGNAQILFQDETNTAKNDGVIICQQNFDWSFGGFIHNRLTFGGRKGGKSKTKK
jgi:hypothetical protein